MLCFEGGRYSTFRCCLPYISFCWLFVARILACCGFVLKGVVIQRIDVVFRIFRFCWLFVARILACCGFVLKGVVIQRICIRVWVKEAQVRPVCLLVSPAVNSVVLCVFCVSLLISAAV